VWAIGATTEVLAALILGVAVGGAATAPHGHLNTATRRITVAALTASMPAGWHWKVERGNYRNCTNQVGRLDLASYRLPAGFGEHEGSIIVPPNGVLLEVVSLPIRSAARPWKGWRLSNDDLRPAHDVGPTRYAAEVELPRSQAIAATAWFGSIRTRRSVLSTANRILSTLRINPDGCQ
jgi:hypothetical protein